MKDATNDSMKKYYGKFPHSVSLTIKRNRLLLFPCLSLRSVITLVQYPCVPHSISRLQHIVVRKYKIHNTHVLLNCFHRLSDRPSKFLVAWHNLRHATDTNPRHYLQYKNVASSSSLDIPWKMSLNNSIFMLFIFIFCLQLPRSAFHIKSYQTRKLQEKNSFLGGNFDPVSSFIYDVSRECCVLALPSVSVCAL